MNLDIREIDRCFYAEHLKDFLPRNIIDIHTHVYLKETANSGSVADKRLVSWTSLVAEDNPVEDLLQILPACCLPWEYNLQRQLQCRGKV